MKKRTCKNCKKPKPETLKYYALHVRHTTGTKSFKVTCRECRRLLDRARPPREYSGGSDAGIAREGKPVTVSSKLCSVCFGMPWCRPVDGECKCRHFYAPEAKPELMMRRHYEAAV